MNKVWFKWIVFIVRWILGLLLIYGAYTETGVWTAIILFLAMVGIEANTALHKRHRRFDHGVED